MNVEQRFLSPSFIRFPVEGVEHNVIRILTNQNIHFDNDTSRFLVARLHQVTDEEGAQLIYLYIRWTDEGRAQVGKAPLLGVIIANEPEGAELLIATVKFPSDADTKGLREEDFSIAVQDLIRFDAFLNAFLSRSDHEINNEVQVLQDPIFESLETLAPSMTKCLELMLCMHRAQDIPIELLGDDFLDSVSGIEEGTWDVAN